MKNKYLCGKIIAELELLEESRHEDSGKKENDTPEEDIRDVGSLGATGAAHKLPTLLNTVLEQQGRVIHTHHMIGNTPESDGFHE